MRVVLMHAFSVLVIKLCAPRERSTLSTCVVKQPFAPLQINHKTDISFFLQRSAGYVGIFTRGGIACQNVSDYVQ